MPQARAYLNRRKVRNIVAARGSVREVISDWEDLRIKTALGQRLGRRTRVSLVRPAWMPKRVYLWLLNSIVADAEEA